MAKKSSRKSVIELWPGHFTATHAVIALSLMLNVALVAVLIAMAQTNVFDDQIVSRGTQILCSDEYKKSTGSADTKALLDFSCNSTGAHTYFLSGYNDYRKSINLPPVTQ